MGNHKYRDRSEKEETVRIFYMFSTKIKKVDKTRTNDITIELK